MSSPEALARPDQVPAAAPASGDGIVVSAGPVVVDI